MGDVASLLLFFAATSLPAFVYAMVRGRSAGFGRTLAEAAALSLAISSSILLAVWSMEPAERAIELFSFREIALAGGPLMWIAQMIAALLGAALAKAAPRR